MTKTVSTPDGHLVQVVGSTGELALSLQLRHSQYQRPRALAQWPHDQDFYLENHLYCKDLRAGSTQELSSSRKSLPPSPLLLTPLYNIPR